MIRNKKVRRRAGDLLVCPAGLFPILRRMPYVRLLRSRIISFFGVFVLAQKWCCKNRQSVGIPDNESKTVDARIKSGKYIKKTDENGVR